MRLVFSAFTGNQRKTQNKNQNQRDIIIVDLRFILSLSYKKDRFTDKKIISLKKTLQQYENNMVFNNCL